MSLLLDILIATASVMITVSVAGELSSLGITRRRPPGAHAKPVLTDPAQRRSAWHRVRFTLLFASMLLAAWANESRDHAVRWLAGIALAVIAAGELRSWLGLSGPGARRESWPELRVVLLTVTAVASVLTRGWQYDTLWWSAAVDLVILAPDIDFWLRARIGRAASGDQAAGPP